MMLKKSQISSQYICKRRITVTILRVISPVHFILKETPGPQSSVEARNFIEAEESMQKYYESLEPSFFQLPLKGSIIVVLFKNKYHRAKVISILSMASGHLFKVYLLDHGEECNVERQWIYEIHEDFLAHPFQAVHFKLWGIEPISLIMSSQNLTMSYGPVENWDISAEIFVNDLKKGMYEAFIEIKAADSHCIFGNLFMTYFDKTVKCINDELVSKTFAKFDENCWENVKEIDDVIANPLPINSPKSTSLYNTPEKQNLAVPEVFPKIDAYPKVYPEFKDFSVSKSEEIDDAIGNPLPVINSPKSKPPWNTLEKQNITVPEVFPKIDANPKVYPEIKDFSVSFIRPTDGKVLATSSLMYDESLQSSTKESKDNLVLKVQSDSSYMLLKLKKLLEVNKRVQNSVPCKSTQISNVNVKTVEKCNDFLHTKDFNNPNIVKNCDNRKLAETSEFGLHVNYSSLNNCHSNAENTRICSFPETSSESEIAIVDTVVQVKSNCVNMLQKLQKLKSQKNQRISFDTNKTFHVKSEIDKANHSSASAIVINIDKNNKKINNLITFKVSDNPAISHSFSSDINHSNLTNALLSSTAENPQKDGNTTLCTISEAMSEKHQMLLKFKKLKEKKLPMCVSSKSQSISKQDEKEITKSDGFDASSSVNLKFLSEPRKLNLSQVSSKTSNEKDINATEDFTGSSLKQSLNFQTLKAFHPLRMSCNKNSTLGALNNLSSNEYSTRSNIAISNIDPSNVSTSLINESGIYSEAESSATKQYCPSKNEDFIVCSSPKSSKKLSKNLDKPESELEADICPSPATNEVHKIPISLSEGLKESFINKICSYQEKVNSEVSETFSESDDMIHTLTKKKEEIFTDKSDIDDYYVDSYAKMKYTSSKHLPDFSELSLWEKQKVPALQIGTAIPNPVLTIEEADFSSHLYKVLKEIKFFGPSCIQSVVWPSMTRSRSLFAIGPPHSGKTVAYVLPLVSTFTDEEVPLPIGTGPISFILCSSWKKAQTVTDLFHLFLHEAKVKVVTLCTDGTSFQHKMLSLINGCDVLISTPLCLLKCFKKKLVNFSRCSNFILDNGTTLITEHKKELKNILLHFINGVKENKVLPQLVVCAERWNKDFQPILDKLMSMPLLFFTSFLESAVFSQIPIVTHVCDKPQKKMVLLDILKDPGKFVICTDNIRDAVDVHHFLRCESVRTYLVNEDMEHYIADEVINDWKSAQCMTFPHCLLITDQALIKMCISSANCLIHYDIPHDSRLQFGNRFSCIAEHFREKESNRKCVCHVFITQSDNKNASHLIEIIENCGRNAPEELIKMYKKQDKMEHTVSPLCRYFKAFGFCHELHCGFRHTIDSLLDKPNIMPCEGDIQGLVTHVVDASHFYVRLFKYLDPESNKTITVSASYAEIGFKLRDFYSHVADEMIVKTPVVGEKYVLAEDALFYRVKILEKVVPLTLSEFPRWKVLYFDEGWIKCYEMLKLYRIDNQFELPRPCSVEVYACSIITPDSCYDWNPITTHLVSDMIKGKEIHGKIVLCLEETLWLDPIVVRTQLYHLNDYINELKLDTQLIDYGHAKKNKNHLTTLKEACSDKVPLPRLIIPCIKNEERCKEDESMTSYAFLECFNCEDVYVSSVISPHNFYVQRAKFVDCLDDLLDKISTQIENGTLQKNFTLCKGMHCIAPFHEDDRYYRAVITDISDSDVHLFYVDFGDSGNASRNTIYYLPQELLLLPFQAIECELAGITAAHGGWSDSTVDTLYNLTRDEAGDMKILMLKAYTKTSSYEGGHHYVVDLWDNQKSFSQLLVEAGYGIPTETVTFSSLDINQNSSASINLSNKNIDLDHENAPDDEIHPDDKDTEALFFANLSKILVQANNRVPNSGMVITEVTSDDEQIDIKTAAMSDKINNIDYKKIHQKSNKVKTYIENLKKDDSIKPLITWWDTPNQLNILINLKEVKLYHLAVTDEGFSFNTILAGKQYSTEEKFYEKIHSATTYINQTILGISITAKKHVAFKWPRLVEGKKRLLHIKYDLIHINDSDSDELSGEVQHSNCQQINQNYEYYTEEKDETTDEDEKYVEPWKETAHYKDPYNPLN